MKMGSEDSVNIEKLPRRILTFFFLVSILLIFGTLSFKFLQDISFRDAFVMTLEILIFQSQDLFGVSRVLEIFLQLFGVILIWWASWSMFDIIWMGNLSEYLKIRGFLSKLEKMRKHYIIAGGGRVGEEIARGLAKANKKYIIIEKDELKLNKLKKKGFFAIHGDVTDESILKKANIKDARALILAMPETEKNLLVTMTAKEMRPDIEIYARADNPAFMTKLKKAGASYVIAPELVAAEKFLENIR